ncbi:hypothetical protein M3F57_14365 [Brachybacterium muris]|uniref:hypothetical protein n=1 Tax=Brachybacterium muris TaxID=219301 RepID=UPI00223A75B0|nr:hypothetical protein [Brachybacterium muris]MCT2297289.1 hypothetical protein [Brachybacterium muris]
MRIVRHLKYREYEEQRIKTNDTVMGLLAGSKLASQTLRLTEGSDFLMGDIFPSIEHVRRFNLTTEKAREVLEGAEGLLGVLAVPQVMALHEEIMVSILAELAKSRGESNSLWRDAKSANVHERIQTLTGRNFTPESLELFHLVRVARNAHIHRGGKADSGLVTTIASCSADALKLWNRITKSSFPAYQSGDTVELRLPELIGILAITKRLAEEANKILQEVLPKSAWADIAIADWRSTRTGGNEHQQDRQLRGLVKMYYSHLNLDETELNAAKIRASAT